MATLFISGKAKCQLSEAYERAERLNPLSQTSQVHRLSLSLKKDPNKLSQTFRSRFHSGMQENVRDLLNSSIFSSQAMFTTSQKYEQKIKKIQLSQQRKFAEPSDSSNSSNSNPDKNVNNKYGTTSIYSQAISKDPTLGSSTQTDRNEPIESLVIANKNPLLLSQSVIRCKACHMPKPARTHESRCQGPAGTVPECPQRENCYTGAEQHYMLFRHSKLATHLSQNGATDKTQSQNLAKIITNGIPVQNGYNSAVQDHSNGTTIYKSSNLTGGNKHVDSNFNEDMHVHRCKMCLKPKYNLRDKENHELMCKGPSNKVPECPQGGNCYSIMSNHYVLYRHSKSDKSQMAHNRAPSSEASTKSLNAPQTFTAVVDVIREMYTPNENESVSVTPNVQNTIAHFEGLITENNHPAETVNVDDIVQDEDGCDSEELFQPTNKINLKTGKTCNLANNTGGTSNLNRKKSFQASSCGSASSESSIFQTKRNKSCIPEISNGKRSDVSVTLGPVRNSQSVFKRRRNLETVKECSEDIEGTSCAIQSLHTESDSVANSVDNVSTKTSKRRKNRIQSDASIDENSCHSKSTRNSIVTRSKSRISSSKGSFSSYDSNDLNEILNRCQQSTGSVDYRSENSDKDVKQENSCHSIRSVKQEDSSGSKKRYFKEISELSQIHNLSTAGSESDFVDNVHIQKTQLILKKEKDYNAIYSQTTQIIPKNVKDIDANTNVSSDCSYELRSKKSRSIIRRKQQQLKPRRSNKTQNVESVIDIHEVETQSKEQRSASCDSKHNNRGRKRNAHTSEKITSKCKSPKKSSRNIDVHNTIQDSDGNSNMARIHVILTQHGDSTEIFKTNVKLNNNTLDKDLVETLRRVCDNGNNAEEPDDVIVIGSDSEDDRNEQSKIMNASKSSNISGCLTQTKLDVYFKSKKTTTSPALNDTCNKCKVSERTHIDCTVNNSKTRSTSNKKNSNMFSFSEYAKKGCAVKKSKKACSASNNKTLNKTSVCERRNEASVVLANSLDTTFRPMLDSVIQQAKQKLFPSTLSFETESSSNDSTKLRVRSVTDINSSNVIKTQISPMKPMHEKQNGHLDTRKVTKAATNKTKTRSKRGNNKNRKDLVKPLRKRKECPDYKLIEGTPFAVDAFSHGCLGHRGVDVYFLTHFHADHYMGLTKKFDKPLYCTQVTANLIAINIKMDSSHIKILEVDKTIKICDVEVTALSANHCPGAIMIMFKLQNGRCILHTGDCRANPNMESYPEFWNNHPIYRLHLDTTYCDPKYKFPPQIDSIQMAVDKTKEWIKTDRNARSLIIVGTYTIGKELIWLELCRRFRYKVWVDPSRRKLLEALEDPEYLEYVEDDPVKADIHVVPLMKVNYDFLSNYLDTFNGFFKRVLGLKPSGWQFFRKPQVRGNITLVGVPYSEHSSYTELCRFVGFLKPVHVLATAGNAKHLDRLLKDAGKIEKPVNTIDKYLVPSSSQRTKK